MPIEIALHCLMALYVYKKDKAVVFENEEFWRQPDLVSEYAGDFDHLVLA